MEIFRLLVLIVSINSNCSGFILSDGFVVTAGHCPIEGTANGKSYTVVKRDEETDIMLLKTEVKGKAKFANAVLGEEVTVLGYGGDMIRILTKGHVASVHNGYLLLDITIFKGESGSAVYNKRGKVVGMVVSGVSDGHYNLTVAVPSRVIEGFVK